ncbi:MAG: energy-coupling factor transporter transmembrane protein EcfT, partial [Gordonia sp. (in: high G+C Gram-positive bacteria)]
MIGVYVPGNSLLHRLPAGFKMLALMAAIITVAVVVRTPMAAWIALAATAAMFLIAMIPFRAAWSQIRGLLWLLGVLFLFQWIVTDLSRAFVVTAILLASAGLAAVVTLTTRTTDMLDAIIGALRPVERFGVRTDLIAMTFALTIRSIPLIADVLS